MIRRAHRRQNPPRRIDPQQTIVLLARNKQPGSIRRPGDRFTLHLTGNAKVATFLPVAGPREVDIQSSPGGRNPVRPGESTIRRQRTDIVESLSTPTVRLNGTEYTPPVASCHVATHTERPLTIKVSALCGRSG